MKTLFILLVFSSSILISQNNYACCINVDELKIKELEEKNIDTSKVYKIQFLLILKKQADAEKASKEAQSIGFTQERLFKYSNNSHSLWVSKNITPNIENLMKVYNELYPIALKYKGIYNDADWNIIK